MSVLRLEQKAAPINAGRQVLAMAILACAAGCATTERPVLRAPVESRLGAPAAQPMAPAPVASQPSERPPAAGAPPELPASVEPLPVELAPQAAPQPALAVDDKLTLLRSWVARQQRLYRVAAPLLVKNTDLCTRFTRNILGFTAKTQFSYSNDFVDVASAGLGLDDRLQVTNVLPGSGADRAGIEPGDILIAAGERPLPTGADAERAASSVIGDAVQGTTSLELTTLRGGETTIVSVMLTPACAMVIDLGNADSASSYADGRRVMVTRGLLDFVRSDDELAFVLAREMAYNIVATTPRPDIAAVIDRLHTLHAQAQTLQDDEVLAPVTPAQDAVVERLALYLLARAGVGLDGVHGFWERLAAAFPATEKNSHAAMHAPIETRLAIIDRVAPELEAKQKNKLALVP